MAHSLSSNTVRKTHERGPPLLDTNGVGRLPSAGNNKTISIGLSEGVVNARKADLSDKVAITVLRIRVPRDE
jgi:hypothetical protein